MGQPEDFHDLEFEPLDQDDMLARAIGPMLLGLAIIATGALGSIGLAAWLIFRR